MALTLQSQLRSRERILATGIQGTGKSNAILSIARRCPDATFHIVDNDVSPSYNRALDTPKEQGGFADLSNVEVYETDPDDWKDGLETVKRVKPDVGYTDWLAFDSMTSPWAAVQKWFTETLHGGDMADYFMAVREQKLKAKSNGDDKKALGALDGWMDWPVINAEYKRLTSELFKVRGHLYLTAELAAIAKEDSQDLKNMWGSYGVKPSGQKNLPYMPHTVLLLTKSRVGEYMMTTIKDRSRVEVVEKVVTDFGKDYLQGVAGWKMKSTEAVT